MQQGLRQNRVKLSIFRALAQADSPLGVNELALSTDVNYRSLATRLPILTRWHYLKRSVGYNYQHRPCFTYSLAAKGRHWLDRHDGRLYFTDLPGEPTQYVCRELLSINDAPLAWLQIYGDDISMGAIRQAYRAYRQSLRSGNNQGVTVLKYHKVD